MIEFIEKPENPTGIYKNILNFAATRGEFIFEDYYSEKNKKNERKLAGYVPKDPNEYILIIIDTIRKVRKERGFNMKETVEKIQSLSEGEC